MSFVFSAQGQRVHITSGLVLETDDAGKTQYVFSVQSLKTL